MLFTVPWNHSNVIISIIFDGTWFLSTQWVVRFSPSHVVWDSFITGFYMSDIKQTLNDRQEILILRTNLFKLWLVVCMCISFSKSFLSSNSFYISQMHIKIFSISTVSVYQKSMWISTHWSYNNHWLTKPCNE